MSIKTKAKAVQGCLWEDEEQGGVSSLAERYLGKAGRILYIHRSIKHPTTIFNASVFTGNGERIWHGDLDIKQATQGLLQISLRIGALFIHYEMSGNYSNGKLSTDDVRVFAAVEVEQGQILYSREFLERIRELSERIALNRKYKLQNRDR